jgi:hypothetical protein
MVKAKTHQNTLSKEGFWWVFRNAISVVGLTGAGILGDYLSSKNISFD